MEVSTPSLLSSLRSLSRDKRYHSDLAASNILFRPSARVLACSDAQVDDYLDEPETEAVQACDG